MSPTLVSLWAYEKRLALSRSDSGELYRELPAPEFTE